MGLLEHGSTAYGTVEAAEVQRPTERARRPSAVLGALVAVGLLSVAIAGSYRGRSAVVGAEQPARLNLDVESEAGQFDFDYVGCFEHAADAETMTFLDAPVTFAECSAAATLRGLRFFVMESPGGGEGVAKCGFGGDYTGYNAMTGRDYTGEQSVQHLRLADSECGAVDAVDGQQHPLGGLFKMAVYELAALHQGVTHSWAIEPTEGDGWTACEAACGSSAKRRRVVCIRSDATVTDDSFCDPDEKPSDTFPCSNYDSCTYHWSASPFSDCAADCGVSHRERTTECFRVELDQVVEESFCDGEDKPFLRERCNDFSLCAYEWVPLSDWGGCDATCGSGAETRTVGCQRSDRGGGPGDEGVLAIIDGDHLDEVQEDARFPFANCNDASKPESSQECWLFHDCDYSWDAQAWSECDASCGDVAVKTRVISCLRVATDDTAAADAAAVNGGVDISFCGGPDEMPEVQDYCHNDHTCTYAWEPREWAACPAGCGREHQHRVVDCVRSDGTSVSTNFCQDNDGDGNGLPAPSLETRRRLHDDILPLRDPIGGDAAGEYCATAEGSEACEPMPPSVQPCESREACLYGWSEPAPWDDEALQCSATCGVGVKTRTVQCVVQSEGALVGEAVDESHCEAIEDEDFLQVPCSDDRGCFYEWNTAEWREGECTAACGGSTMPRVVSCERRAISGDQASSIATVVDSFCGGERPAEHSACYSTDTCNYSWKAASWGECASGCGQSTQTREVWCERSDDERVADEECARAQAGLKMQAEQQCLNYDNCSYAWHLDGGEKQSA